MLLALALTPVTLVLLGLLTVESRLAWRRH